MLVKLSSLWDAIRGSLWAVPTLMAALSVSLAFTTLWLDHGVLAENSASTLAWMYGGGADGAREVLSTIASSMINVVGVIFSVTVVALTLASRQFGPRLLRNFMRDPGNQIVLGTFISVHLYCLIVLRTVRAEAAGGFVPHLSVFIALLLAVASIAVLIFFFHHATSSIRASNVIAAVAQDLEQAIEKVFPEKVEQPGPPPDRKAKPSVSMPEDNRRPVASSVTGYVQAVDTDSLIALAKDNNMVIHLACNPGDFVVRDTTTIASVFPFREFVKTIAEELNAALILGDERTVVQDVRFPAHQLMEIAVRALSPGTNDPSTALACIDRLGAAYAHLAARCVPSPYRYDDTGALRLIAHPVTLGEMVEQTFGQIRQYGRTSSAVTIRLLEAIAMVAPRITSDADRAALAEQAAIIHRGSLDGLPDESDRRDVSRHYETARDALQVSLAA